MKPNKYEISKVALGNCRIVAPRIAGMARRNENDITSSFFIPNSNPVEIVEPDLDIPGMIASACEIPIMIDSLYVIGLLL